MTTLTVKDNEISVIIESLKQRKKLLQLKLQSYQQKLKDFEKKYNMTSEIFLKKYLDGQLGDDAYLIEWEFLIEAETKIKEKLNKINNINI